MTKDFEKTVVEMALLSVAPQTKDELFVLADALHLWQSRPEFQSGALKSEDGVSAYTAAPMLYRVAMAIALLKIGPTGIPNIDNPSKVDAP